MFIWTNDVIFATDVIFNQIMKKALKTGKPISQGKTSRPSKVSDPESAYAVRAKETVLEYLGLASKAGSPRRPEDHFFIDLIRKGLPKKVFDHLIKRTGLTEDEMSIILHVSKRTLQRRDQSAEFNPEQSERLIELAKLFTKGEDLLGGPDQFKEWINTRVWSLGDKKPKEFMDTSIGLGLLMDELGRIEYGVHS